MRIGFAEFLPLVCLSAACALGQVPTLPDAERWKQHAMEELIPFWTSPASLGDPVGAFASTRCDDGALYDPAQPCPEIQRNTWLRADRRYLVPMSRQTYGFGVAFHLTGDRKYLEYMKAGVDYIRQNMIDRERGGMYTELNLVTGAWGVDVVLRDPQQLGYGLLGLSFYYYLTRDPDVLADILWLKRYIINSYYNVETGALNWFLAPTLLARYDDKRLVAQLDQMNAYLVLLAPILPEPHASEWRHHARNLVGIMANQFYEPEQNLFFLGANRPEDFDIRVSGVDFGHTIKALWMIRWTGIMLGDINMVAWAEERGLRVLERAYLPDSGSWASGLLAGGAMDRNKSWWIYAELDQFAASVGVQKPKFAVHLPDTYDYWLNYFVDREHGEVWNGVQAGTNAPIRDLPKAWQWKSAYHSMEHALVAYIASKAMEGEPVTLYYAFGNRPRDAELKPYFFSGAVDRAVPVAAGSMIWAVTYTGVR